MCYAHGPFLTDVAKTSRTMTQPLFEQLVEEVGPHVEAISLTNFGEPFCDAKLPERLAVIRKFPKVVLILQTNGTLLDLEHLELLKGLPNRVWFSVSVDSLDPVVYASIRTPAKLATVVSNLRLLRHNARQIGFDIAFIELNATLMLRNLASAPQLIDFAVEVGANGVRLLHMTAVDPSLACDSVYRAPAYTNRVLARCREKALAAGLSLEAVNPFAITPEEKAMAKLGGRTCGMIDDMIQVAVTGEVWPCCGDLPLIGDIGKGERIAAIWGGNRHQRLRKAIWDGHPVEACQTCKYLERLAPFIDNASLAGMLLPGEQCSLAPDPDFDTMGALRWLDEMPEAEVRSAVRSGLLDALRNAPGRERIQPVEELVEILLVRVARKLRFVSEDSWLRRGLRRGWKRIRRRIERSRATGHSFRRR
jgi:MoaA/NifB/PqqE/SkfB family radical SAM enzyme